MSILKLVDNSASPKPCQLLYGMKSWLIIELPDGQIFIYYSYLDTPLPLREDMLVGRDIPVFCAPVRQT
ncbi:unnamed protein product [Penicillium roqueforti FM164]|uniref:Genomic scaffold, ProqFM164S02 n=1 Tax=Penicillium roqueforti (strain FM164) TaxID=1365484 RepID=W6Q772_PENRF|nr:unnamed protein product [Penicillium roqueforti FM164]